MGRVSAGGYQVWGVRDGSVASVACLATCLRRQPILAGSPRRARRASPYHAPPRHPCVQTGGIPGVGGRMVPNAAMLARSSLVKVH